MSREDGFQVADLDINLLHDPKVRVLWRILHEPGAMAHAMLLYVAVILASWGTGDRQTIAEAAPIWLDAPDDLVDALHQAGLLDGDGRIPVHAWAGWFDPAYQRREARRAGGRKGGLAAHGIRPQPEPASSHARTEPDPTVPVPTGPTDPVPTVRQSPTNGTPMDKDEWASYGPEWDPFRAAWMARGFRLPPTPAQRAVLWGEGESNGVIQGWPLAAGRWVEEAPPGANAARVVQHVLNQYHLARDEAARNAT